MRLHTRDCLQLAEITNAARFDLYSMDGSIIAHFDCRGNEGAFPSLIGLDDDMAVIRTAYLIVGDKAWYAEFDEIGLSRVIERGPNTAVPVWQRPECKPIANGIWEYPVKTNQRIVMLHRSPNRARDYTLINLYNSNDDRNRSRRFRISHSQSFRWGFASFFTSEAWQQLRELYPSVERVHEDRVWIKSDTDYAMFLMMMS